MPPERVPSAILPAQQPEHSSQPLPPKPSLLAQVGMEKYATAFKAVGLQIIISHLSELPKTLKQQNPGASYVHNMQLLLGQSGGIFNFSRGFLPTATGIAFRQAYRVPTTMATKAMLDAVIPEETQKTYPTLTKNLSLLALATFWDPAVMTPLERLRVLDQTRPSLASADTTPKKQGPNLLSLTHWYGSNGSGYFLMLLRQSNFLGFTFATPAFVEWCKGEKLTPGETTASTTAGGVIASITGTPVDVLKTDVQKANGVPLGKAWQHRVGQVKDAFAQGHIQGCKKVAEVFFVGQVPRTGRIAAAAVATAAVVDASIGKKSSPPAEPQKGR